MKFKKEYKEGDDRGMSPGGSPAYNLPVIPLLIMFMTQLEVLLVFMTQAMEPIVMWTYSRPVQNSLMAHNLVP
jgi:hypothetical protein